MRIALAVGTAETHPARVRGIFERAQRFRPHGERGRSAEVRGTYGLRWAFGRASTPPLSAESTTYVDAFFGAQLTVFYGAV